MISKRKPGKFASSANQDNENKEFGVVDLKYNNAHNYDVESDSINAEGGKAIAVGLQENKTLLELDLSKYPISITYRR